MSTTPTQRALRAAVEGPTMTLAGASKATRYALQNVSAGVGNYGQSCNHLLLDLALSRALYAAEQTKVIRLWSKVDNSDEYLIVDIAHQYLRFNRYDIPPILANLTREWGTTAAIENPKAWNHLLDCIEDLAERLPWWTVAP